MKRRILLICLLAGLSSVLHGQNNIPDKLESLFDTQLSVFPQEKIYLHTDKPYYISGEKIWFRAYVADAKSHIPVTASRYVYVELINPLDSILARVKIRQEEGTYHGYLPIPETAPGGDYTMRAYTAFMRNQDEHYFFTKPICIGDPQAKAVHPAAKFDDDFDVSFYPEGGSLMQGIFCKVAFKAMKSNGQAADISGTVYDQSGTEIKTFNSDSPGMGSFPLLAEKGKNYYAICQNEKGISKRFDLPAAVERGYALSANVMKDKIHLTVLKPVEVAENETLYLLAHTRGIVHFVMPWNFKRDLSLQPEQFPSGVLHLILFDAGQNPVSERLVFINNPDQAQVNCLPDKESYTIRDLVKHQVVIAGSEGQALAGSFSVAVTSDREVQTDTTSNILTHLLLSSDLRGNIENPAYYFQNNNSSLVALDLLMCTQGWRRYNIAELAQGRFAQPTIPIETDAEISGAVQSAVLGKAAKNHEVTIMSYKDDYFDKTETDKDGRFYFRGIEWPDSTRFFVSAAPGKGWTNPELILDREIFPERTLSATPPARIDRRRFAEYVDKAEQKYVFENGVRMIYLPEVKVTAQTKPLRKSVLYDSPDAIITGEKIQMSGVTNIAPLLTQIAGVSAKGDGAFIGDIRIRNSWYLPLIIIDDMVASLNDLNDIPISSIDQIDVLKGPNIFGMRGANGVIVVYTKRGEIMPNNTISLHIKDLSPLGYQQAVEFYAPKYDTPEKRNGQAPDLRTTIHWQPVVQTDNQGVASFEFYTADESGSYTMVIEGLAEEGSIIRQERKVWVKDEKE